MGNLITMSSAEYESDMGTANTGPNISATVEFSLALVSVHLFCSGGEADVLSSLTETQPNFLVTAIGIKRLCQCAVTLSLCDKSILLWPVGEHHTQRSITIVPSAANGSGYRHTKITQDQERCITPAPHPVASPSEPGMRH